MPAPAGNGESTAASGDSGAILIKTAMPMQKIVPGPDLSQTHELREYRSGDSLRSIHWKRSSRGNLGSSGRVSCRWAKTCFYFWKTVIRRKPARAGQLKDRQETKKGTPQDAIEKACARLIALSGKLN